MFAADAQLKSAISASVLLCPRTGLAAGIAKATPTQATPTQIAKVAERFRTASKEIVWLSEP
jgi:hypothetical protein